MKIKGTGGGESPKRKNGDGTFIKLSNGTIQFTISLGVDAETGKRKRKKFYGRTEGECRKQYKAFIKEGEECVQPQSESEKYTLSAWIEDVWLPTYKKNKVEGSTYEDYRGLAGHIKGHRLGGMELASIKPMHVTEYFASKADYSASFLKRSKYLLNAAFETAIDNDLCDRNPVRRSEMVKKVQPEKEAYTESEVTAMANYAKQDDLFGVAMYIMLNTGVRSQEIQALQVEQVDLTRGIVTIDRAIKRTGEIGLPKNNKTRYIPLDRQSVEFLRTKLQGKTGYIVGNSHYVSREGFRSRHLWFFDRLNKYLLKEGESPVEMKSPHATRHTFGTLCQKRGMPIAIVSALMGHCSTDVTDKYTHLSDVETLSEAVQKYSFWGNDTA